MGTSTLILAENSPVWPLAAGADVKIYGTTGTDKITIPLGTTVTFDSSFNKGGDTIYIQGDTSDFTVQHASGTVTLTHKDGSVIIIPAGVANSLVFGDGDVSLKIDAGKVMFGDQAVTTTAAAVTATLGTTTSDSQFGGGVTPEPGDYTITCDASVAESGTLTVTVTADAAVTADTELSFSIAGLATGPSGDAAEADDFVSATSGKVTIPKDGKTATFQIKFDAKDGADFDEDFKISLKDASNTVVATKTVTILDSETEDTTAPVATANTFNYNENVADKTKVLGTVAATDNVAVTGFEIASGNDSGYFAIDSKGNITLTDAGLKSVANDAEQTPNTFTIGVKAVDAAGNKSAAVDVKLEVKDVDDTPPAIKSAVILGNKVTINFGEDLDTASGSPSSSDFVVHVTQGSSTGVNNVVGVLVNTTSVELTLASPAAAGQTFKLDYTPGANPLQDKAGNDVISFVGQAVVTDTTAPVIAAGQTKDYVEGTNDDVNDIVYTVQATDADSVIAKYEIVSGNSDGFYAINSTTGAITLTAAGLASTAASNDFETTPNSFTLGIKATDAAGNSSTGNVVINIKNNTADDAEQPLELAFKVGTDTQEGKSGNDTFTGDSNTIDAGDVIDGNGGIDTAMLFLDAAAGGVATEQFTSREVEIMKVQASGGLAKTLTATNFTGVTEIWNNQSSDALTIADLTSIPKLGIIGGDGTDNFIVNYRAGVTTGNQDIEIKDGGRIANLNIGSADGTQEFTSVSIKSTGSANNTIADILDGGGAAAANMTKVTVTGDKALTITNELENVTTFDASGSSGGLRVVIDDGAGVNVTFTGGSGNDSVNIQAANLTADDKLAGGTGTDTLIVNNINGQLSLINAAGIKEFEVLNTVANGAGTVAGVQAAETSTVDIDNIITNNSLTGVTISGGSLTAITDGNGAASALTDLADTIVVNNINSGAVNNITITLTDDTGDTATIADSTAPAFNDTTTAQTDNVTLTGKGFLPGGTSDTATIDFNNRNATTGAAVDASGIDVNTLTFVNLDVLNIKSTADTTPSAAEQGSIGDLVATDLEKIVVTGNQSFSLTTDATSNALTEVDASGLTGTTSGTYGFTLDTHAATAITSLLVKGTTDVDTLNTSSEGTATSFLTGGGSDIITIDEGSSSTLHFVTTTMGTGDMIAGNTITVNGLLSQNDLMINLSSGVEAVLKSATTVLGSAASNVALTSTIDANSNVAFFDAIDGDNDGNADDFVIRIDLDGNGSFAAASDWQVVIVDGAATLSGVTYNATNDVFVLTGPFNAVNGTANADAALTGTAADDVITGNGGDDVITGLAGADIIHGGEGADTITGGAGIDTINLTETVASVDTVSLNLIIAVADRDVINGFTAGAGGDIIQIAAASTTLGTLATVAPVFTADTTAAGVGGGAYTLTGPTTSTADIIVLQSGASLTSGANGGDLSAATDGTELLKALTTNAAADTYTSITAVASSTGFMLAYQGGNAYLYYYAEADAAATLEADEIFLIGTLNTVAANSLVQGNFDLV